MKKVVYSLTRFRKYENQVKKGIGYITDEDLIITIFKNGKEEKRKFEDCLRYCHKIITTEDQYTGHFTEYENVEIIFCRFYKNIVQGGGRTRLSSPAILPRAQKNAKKYKIFRYFILRNSKCYAILFVNI